MHISMRNKLLNTTKLTSKKTPMLFASMAMATAINLIAPHAYAQDSCTPDRVGTAGSDIITCTGDQPSGNAGIVRGEEGDDTINVTDANANGVNFDVEGDEGSDTITVTNSIVNDLRSDSATGTGEDVTDGNDLITFTNSTLTEQLYLGGGNDRFSATGSTINDLYVGSGNDIVTLDNSTLDSFFNSLGGDETITLTNGSLIDSSVNIGDGVDVVSLDNSTIDGSLTVGNSSADDGADTVTLTNNSEIDGNINLGEGNDRLTATNSIIDGTINSTGGDDTIILTNVTELNGLSISEGADTVLLDNTILSGTLDVGLTNANDSGDTVSVLNGSVVGGRLDTGFGDDDVIITNSEIGGIVTLGDGNDTIVANNAVIDERIEGGDGNDMITLLNSDNTALNFDVEGEGGDDVIVITNAVLNDVRGDNVSASSADGNDTITITNSTIEEQVTSTGGDDVVTLANAMVLNDGNTGSASVNTGTGDDVVNLTGGVINGFIDLGNDNDTAVFDAGTTINTTSNFFVTADTGSDNITVNGGEYTSGLQLGIGGSEPDDIDELVINGGTIDGLVQLGQGNDLVTVNDGTLVQGIGIVGLGWDQETIVINGGTVGTNPNNGHSIFTGEETDQVGIFGGDVQSFVSLGSGDDLLVIDAGGDEFTSAETQVFAPGTFIGGPVSDVGGAVVDGLDLSHAVTGGALIATPTEFLGGTGEDVAEIFDLVDTNNLDFESFNDVNFYGLSITLADDAAGEQSQSIDNLRLLRGSTLTQITGNLDISGESGSSANLIVDGTSIVTLQDGMVGDVINVSTFAPQAGSLLAVDVDVVSRGFVAADSDHIVGTVHTPEAGAIVNVNTIGSADLSGSRRIVDGGADVADPGVGATVDASSTYVLQNDPSTGARRFWLQDGEDGGVYLVWTTPISSETASAFFGGGAVLAGTSAADADLAIDGDDVSAAANSVSMNAGAFGAIANIGDMAAQGAGASPRSGGQKSQTSGTARSTRGGTYHPCPGKGEDWNAWVSGSLSTSEFGSSDADNRTVAVGIERDLDDLFETNCGRVAFGAFAYFSDSETDAAFGSNSDITSQGLGAYLRGSTEKGYYGAVSAFIGENEVESFNAVLESNSEYDADAQGVALTLGKATPLNEGLNLDLRGQAFFGTSGSDPFTDTNDLTIDAIDSDALVLTGTVGLDKTFAETANVFGRVGVKYSDYENELNAFGITVDSQPSFTTGIGEIGASKNFNNTFRGEIAGFGELGSDVETYGIRGRLSAKF